MKRSSLVFDHVHFRRGAFSLEVDTSFPEGRLTVVLGPSGCGKTTLLDLAAGFIHPSSGRILEGSLDVTLLPPDKREVGVVFQELALFPNLNVRRNVAFGPISRGSGRKFANQIADTYLDLVRMTGYSTRKPASLSGGEQQRVSLARALAIEPGILLLDEPFSSLDAALRKNLGNELRRIQRETGITAVLVTHDQDEALSLADHLVVMRHGRVVCEGDPFRLWKDPADLFTAMFLGRSTRLEVTALAEHPGGGLQAVTSAGKLRLNPGAIPPLLPAVLFVRPEDIRIAGDGPLRGTVASSEFAGGAWRVRLSTGDPNDLIDCDFHGARPPAPGEILRLDVGPGAFRIIPGRISDGI